MNVDSAAVDLLADLLDVVDDDWTDDAWSYAVIVEAIDSSHAPSAILYEESLIDMAFGLIAHMIIHGWAVPGDWDPDTRRFRPWEATPQEAVGRVAADMLTSGDHTKLGRSCILEITPAGTQELARRRSRI